MDKPIKKTRPTTPKTQSPKPAPVQNQSETKTKPWGKLKGGKIEQFPKEIWQLIAEETENKDLLNLSATSKGMRKAFTQEPIVKQLKLTLNDLSNKDFDKFKYAEEHNLDLQLNLQDILEFPNALEILKEFIENSPHAQSIKTIEIDTIDKSNRDSIRELLIYLNTQKDKLPNWNTLSINKLAAILFPVQPTPIVPVQKIIINHLQESLMLSFNSNLHELEIHTINQDVSISLGHNLNNLEKLTLGKYNDFKVENFSLTFPSNYPNLKELNLYNCPQYLTPMQFTTTMFPQLKKLTYPPELTQKFNFIKKKP